VKRITWKIYSKFHFLHKSKRYGTFSRCKKCVINEAHRINDTLDRAFASMSRLNEYMEINE
jgi:hypothetical protein